MQKPTLQHKHVEILSEKTVYKGHFAVTAYELRHQQFAGDMSPVLRREIFRTRPAAGVLPYDPVRDEIVLIEQMRAGTLKGNDSPWIYEVIAGVIEDNDQSIEARIRQEALEEANLTLGKLIPIHSYWVSPGCSAERYTLFCGEVDSSKANGVHGNKQEGEDIKVHVFPRHDVIEALKKGIINNGSTLIALQWLMLQRYEGDITQLFS